MKQVNTGGLPFQRIRDNDKYYIDKSLLIKDILDMDDCGVYLFTRPRRFGKTTNITMLDAFFNIRYRGTHGSMIWRSRRPIDTFATRTPSQSSTST